MKAWRRSGLANTFRIRLTGDDAAVIVESTVADAVAWENAHRGQSFQENISASSLLWTAWRALRREGLATERFESWADRVLEFEMADPEAEEDVDGLDPTRPDLPVD
ncbi:MAG: hypothetical protein QM753_06795 [Thermomicrobiales bacterium]